MSFDPKREEASSSAVAARFSQQAGKMRPSMYENEVLLSQQQQHHQHHQQLHEEEQQYYARGGVGGHAIEYNHDGEGEGDYSSSGPDMEDEGPGGPDLRTFANSGGGAPHQQHHANAGTPQQQQPHHHPTPHIRTNFGKYRGYDPPATAPFHGSSAHRNSKTTAAAMMQSPVGVAHEAGDGDDDVPFDQQGDTSRRQLFHHSPHGQQQQQYYEHGYPDQQGYIDQRYDEEHEQQQHYSSSSSQHYHDPSGQQQQQHYRDVESPSSPRPFDEAQQQRIAGARSSPDRAHRHHRASPGGGGGRRPAAGILDMAPQSGDDDDDNIDGGGGQQQDYVLPMLSMTALRSHDHLYSNTTTGVTGAAAIARSDPGVANTSIAMVTPRGSSSNAGAARIDPGMYHHNHAQQQQKQYVQQGQYGQQHQQQHGYYENVDGADDDHGDGYAEESGYYNAPAIGNHFRMAPPRVSSPVTDADFFEYDEYGNHHHQHRALHYHHQNYNNHDPYNEDDDRRIVMTPSPTSDSLFVHRPTSPNAALTSPGAITTAISNGNGNIIRQQLQQSSMSYRQQHQQQQGQYYDRRSANVNQSYEEFGIANGASVAPPPPVTLSANTTPVRKSALKKSTDTTTEEEDSLFDFEEQRRKQDLKSRKKQQRSRMRRMKEEEDDTSDDAYGTPPTSSSRSSINTNSRLATRAQAAWKRKSARERASRQKATIAGAGGTTSNSSAATPPQQLGVSFGENNNTIHRYEAEEADTTTIGDVSTLGGRSLNSEYTKSLESEVEDAFRDIFMIGSARKNNPGRRKIKYRTGSSNRLLGDDEDDDDDEDEEDEDDETLETETLEDTETLGTDQSASVVPFRKSTVEDPPSSSNIGTGRSTAVGGGGASVESSMSETIPRPEPKHKSSLRQSKHRGGSVDEPKVEEKKDDGEIDPLREAWSLFESSLSAFGAALGIEKSSKEPVATTSTSSTSTRRHHAGSERRGVASSSAEEDNVPQPKRNSSSSSSHRQQSRRVSSSIPTVSCTGDSLPATANRLDKIAREKFIDYATQVVNHTNATEISCGPMGLSGLDGQVTVDKNKNYTTNRNISNQNKRNSNKESNSITDDDLEDDDEDDNMAGAGGGLRSLSFLNPAPSLEEDLRLIELAVQAARSFHKLHGFVYDDSHEIDIVSEIKFIVVDLCLPLGLIFQENECGCWITRVMPAGSAAKKGAVIVGDQLAAIDGISAIHLKVDQVAAAIRSKNTEFELTFLRYVGPLRPAVNNEEDKTAKINLKNAPTNVAAADNGRVEGHGSSESTPQPKTEANVRKKSDSRPDRCRLGAKDRGSDMEQMHEVLACAQGSKKKSDKQQQTQEVLASAQGSKNTSDKEQPQEVLASAQGSKKKSDKQQPQEVLASAQGSKKKSDKQQPQEVLASAHGSKKKSDKQQEVLASPQGSKKKSDQQQLPPAAGEKRPTGEKKRFRLFGRLKRPVE